MNVKDWLSPLISDLSWMPIGITDPSKHNTVALYSRRGKYSKIAIGGLNNTSTWTKGICLLIQWSSQYNESEIKAQSIYELFNGQTTVIDGRDTFFRMKDDEPVPLGKNEHGIYEFTIDVVMTYKRG